MRAPTVLLLLTGAAVLRVSLFSELYLRYVQPALRPYLIVSGCALVLLGLVSAVLRRDAHSHTPRAAWLLALPALALLLFPPPALGSYSAEREAEQRLAQGMGTFPKLPSDPVLDLTLAEFSSRAVYDTERSLQGRTVRLTGFVTQDDDGTWYVTRLAVACCAADATVSKVEIRGTSEAPPTDTWVTVTGTWRAGGTVLDARSVRTVRQPANPYEKRT
ncbi:TIGR03943 family putative permease subunit [Streptomyces pharetrae]|uniref:TIGR03943 family putative permease subunit n=1 Tax=Streptomyces pharetrae TaxID=291370 RepID=UPI0036622DE6